MAEAQIGIIRSSEVSLGRKIKGDNLNILGDAVSGIIKEPGSGLDITLEPCFFAHGKLDLKNCFTF